MKEIKSRFFYYYSYSLRILYVSSFVRDEHSSIKVSYVIFDKKEKFTKKLVSINFQVHEVNQFNELNKIENGFDMSCVVIELKFVVIIFHSFCLNKLLSLVVNIPQKCNADKLIAM